MLHHRSATKRIQCDRKEPLDIKSIYSRGSSRPLFVYAVIKAMGPTLDQCQRAYASDYNISRPMPESLRFRLQYLKYM